MPEGGRGGGGSSADYDNGSDDNNDDDDNGMVTDKPLCLSGGFRLNKYTSELRLCYSKSSVFPPKQVPFAKVAQSRDQLISRQGMPIQGAQHVSWCTHDMSLKNERQIHTRIALGSAFTS